MSSLGTDKCVMHGCCSALWRMPHHPPCEDSGLIWGNKILPWAAGGGSGKGGRQQRAPSYRQAVLYHPGLWASLGLLCAPLHLWHFLPEFHNIKGLLERVSASTLRLADWQCTKLRGPTPPHLAVTTQPVNTSLTLWTTRYCGCCGFPLPRAVYRGQLCQLSTGCTCCSPTGKTAEGVKQHGDACQA